MKGTALRWSALEVSVRNPGNFLNSNSWIISSIVLLTSQREFSVQLLSVWFVAASIL